MKVVLHLTNPKLIIYNIQVNRKMNLFNLSYKNLIKFGLGTGKGWGLTAVKIPEEPALK